MMHLNDTFIAYKFSASINTLTGREDLNLQTKHSYHVTMITNKKSCVRATVTLRDARIDKGSKPPEKLQIVGT